MPAPPDSSPPATIARPAAAGSNLALIALFAGAVSIGAAPILVRLADVAPVASAFWRVALALPVLWAWEVGRLRRVRAGGATADGPLPVLGLVLAGVFFAADLALWHLSILWTTVANATLLANVAPVFVVLGGFLFFSERFSGRFLAGLVLAMVGVAALIGASAEIGGDRLAGDALGLATAVCYAGYIVAVARVRARAATATVMLWSSLVTAVVLLPLALLAPGPFWPAGLDGWLVLAALALVTQVGGQGLIAYALAHLPAAFGSVSLLVQPVIAAGLAWLLFAEALGPLELAGAGLVLAGIAMARRGTR